jgi:ribosomal protein L3 glutamine methyltransferase
MNPGVPSLAALTTVRDLIRWGASEFGRSGLIFGHGTDNALDEAFHLVLHALSLPFDLPAIYLETHVTNEERVTVIDLLQQRISSRKPTAYLLGEMIYCGLNFKVDERVLIPRSPFAELIEKRFAPWLPNEPTRILDLCTGSGCIGIAAAQYFPEAEVDLADISEDALALCSQNVALHGLEDRVNVVVSDVFDALSERYDLIISNPPYVPTAEWQALAREYQHEPKLALEAGVDGMDVVAKILKGAVAQLQDGGWLFCEVGGSVEEFEARWPLLPVIWCEFERGGDGVFAISKAMLVEAGF